ncbi:unnamed protein product [Cylicocyclus nassatus]|uniref:PNPLA domain-containing protein n=1 Tax=Cylicocyclus nassatus TaxID=53992 RepID=A0AA36H8D4_CYLNA|nr:unnamed protein product [Cylicocyclus nassatus]
MAAAQVKVSPAITDSAETALEPIFQMVVNGDLEGLINSYLGHENFRHLDELGNNLLHYAAKYDKREMARGIAAITAKDALWAWKNNAGDTPIDVASSRIKRDLLLISRKGAPIADHHTNYNNRLVKEKIKNADENHKVILSFDGGGIKAILETAILKAIEEELGEPLLNRVHWIGGTSCGGIIAVTLGLGLSIEQCKRIFMCARRQTFCGNNMMFPKHNSRGIEELLRQTYGPQTTMASLKQQKVLVTAAKIKSAPPQLVLFRSYAPRVTPREYEKYGYMNPEKILVWKAARATSAAPVFFESFHGLADGAIFCNNPCLTLLTEFFRLQKIERHKNLKNDDKVGCVITIGSGAEPSLQLGGIDINLSSPFALGKDFMNIFGKGKNLITLFMYQCTSSHAVSVGQAREWAHSLGIPYFRFSPRLSRAYDLDSIAAEGIFDFWFETEVYLKTQAHQEIVNLCRLLRSMPKAGVQKYSQSKSS